MVITGAGGFIGRRLCNQLNQSGCDVVPVGRGGRISVGSIDGNTDWAPVLRRGATIIHLAALAHMPSVGGTYEDSDFLSVNVHGTRRLASEAAKVGVKRLVFVSSIGVLGSNTNGRSAFTIADEPSPVEMYARSKFEAEQVLRDIGAATAMEISIVRPPLVYGPNAPGNFGRLVSLIRRGLPLPLGSVHNRRSLVGLDNLVDLIGLCVMHPAAAGETFLAADSESVSTPELIRTIAYAMKRRAALLPVPVQWLRVAGRALGKSAEVERLVGSLEIDISHTCETLGWTPPVHLREGLRRAVQC